MLSIILSLTVQTMTYTGQGGGRFPLARHIPVHEAARIVCRESGGTLQAEDFTTRPSAHPLCYLVGYLLKTGDRLLLFAPFAPKEEIRQPWPIPTCCGPTQRKTSSPTQSTGCMPRARPNT